MPDGLYIGVLSGTSVDAVDTVLARFSPRLEVLAAHTLAYPGDLRRELLALALPGEAEIDRMGAADVRVGRHFARAVSELLAQAGVAPGGIRAVGSHGQTIRHRPGGAAPFTLQIGDPNIIAALTGLPVVADFRRKDVALGGQGAPLVPAFHAAVFRNSTENRFIVNIGGIANVTALPADPSAPVLGFDTGPGNTLLDGWCRRHTGEAMDRDGRLAASGNVVSALLAAMLDDPYFGKNAPKSTGPEYFSTEWLGAHLSSCTGVSPADVQATLLALTARSIASALRQLPGGDKAAIYLCGGGANNRVLRQAIQVAWNAGKVDTTATLGLPVDRVEGLAFAWLARQRLLGEPGNLPAVTGASRPGVLGGLFLPV